MILLAGLVPLLAFAAACNGVTPTGSSAITSIDANEAGGNASALSGGNDACRLITDVKLRILPDDGTGYVVLQAQYRYQSPEAGECSIVPVWTASRRGLGVNPCTPFMASIERKTEVRTIVTTTGPNGRSAKVTF
jgi:hypothetical protein